MSLTVGSLCTGTAQYERALTLAGVDTEVAFVADPDPGASTLLAHHYPDVPNLGDIKAVDWTRVTTVDILTAGYPCQGFSLAGQRLGENDDRFIWPHVFAAVRDLRPRVVLLENVPGHLSLGFGRVLGDLASIGYVGRWVCVRASDVGAAHKRERVFIVAHEKGDDPAAALRLPATGAAHGRGGDGAVLTGLLPTPRASAGGASPGREAGNDRGANLGAIVGSLLPTPRATDTGTPGRRASEGFRPPLSEVVLPLFPTPRARDGKGRDPNPRGVDLNEAVALLPTPAAVRSGRQRSASAGAAIRPSLDMVHALLPTPTVTNANGNGYNNAGALLLPGVAQEMAAAECWGQYAPAIARWAEVMGRLAPDPTEPGRDGKRRLSPRFAEWLMGHLDGFVTDVPGLTRSRQLKAIGNGIVALQGALAVCLLVAASS